MENNFKVLIVDDIEENLQVVSNLLGESKFAILIARSGKQAIKIALKKNPDLILLDISMPEMDGFETCTILKSNKETKEIPIIFLTAHLHPEDIIKGFKHGAIDYITKPFNKEELIMRVYNHLNLKKSKDIINKQKKKLEKQNNELTEANATKDKFFSIIAHDLKNPMSSILGFSELLNTYFDKYDTVKIKKYIKLIENDTKNIHKLLENLLTWSRSQRGLIQYIPNKLKLTGLVTEITMALKNMANQKGISLEVNIQESLMVYADKNMLSTVIRNLVSNAIKFTSHRGWVKIYIEYGKQQNKTIKIIVEDNGVGIDAESLKKLFKIEQNCSTEGTDHEKGSGLGLILCKEFVEKNKGAIWAESNAGVGSKFIFTLPTGK